MTKPLAPPAPESRDTPPSADAKPTGSASAGSGPELLALVRRDSDAAREELQRLRAHEIADRVQEIQPSLRDELLSLVERPEQVVPLLPEAELASTIRASGMSEAAWLLELATPEQRVACVDLDCWRDVELSRRRLTEWVDALIEAGPHTLAASLDELDPELWVLILKHMADFAVAGREDDPPPASLTEDGVVFYSPRADADAERLEAILRIAFSENPGRYWQLVYGVIFESGAECEEYALRWHRARLNDLGFPDREQALRVYQPLAVEDAPLLELGTAGSGSGGLVAAPRVPQRLAGTLVGRALAELPPDRAADVLGYVLAVCNSIAVADRLSFAEAASIEWALRKAVRGIDRGLVELAKARGQRPSEILDSTSPPDLFRIGATLDPELKPGRALGDLEEEEEHPDWDVEIEVLDPDDP